ncbi:Starch-binding associating with outer membrane [Mucilaginibacter mallensis]|uniref:Starch-binding associating with outer membrane n=1 Tax=Mucilaginibacter mallensis TaxID=652787 RepID=A0A1H2BHC2_MUCMA|nr:RagB/SusD family nutrient uptake outer membrane protein [Mucilaginibacter mallensis]SDT57653.1 Starch-binding associating with outer membrane [Mucilaginibacter mallensis]
MKKIFLILIAAGSLSACNKLDENPTSYITASRFYKTQSDAAAGVTGIYSELTSDGSEQPLYGREINFLADMTTDDLSAGPSAINPNVRALSSITYTATDDRLQVIWRQLYTGISRANAAIDAIPTIQFDTTLRSRYVREAKFLRGLFYFNLVRFYGDVPLVLHNPADASNLNSLKVDRSPAATVYAQIIADLTDAQNLPSTYSGSDIGRATGGAAKSLLVKIFLTQKDWTDAISKAKEVINGNYGYALFPNYADVFNPSTKNGVEHIFSAQISSNGGLGNSSSLMGANFAGFVGNVPADIPADSSVYKQFSSTDTRKAVTFYTSLVNPTTGLVYNFPTFYFGKYVDRSELLTPGQSNINFPVLRYADVLLMYAEALNEVNGPVADAYTAINQVRVRANTGTLTTGLSQTAFRDSLYAERRREFVQEAQRWFDLVRTGQLVQAVSKVSSKTNVATRNYLYPIPQSEISLNPGLTQNPGYTN